jgi:hypothetical protein
VEAGVVVGGVRGPEKVAGGVRWVMGVGWGKVKVTARQVVGAGLGMGVVGSVQVVGRGLGMVVVEGELFEVRAEELMWVEVKEVTLVQLMG